MEQSGNIYEHKKFSTAQKRKRSQASDSSATDDDVIFVMEAPATTAKLLDQPPAKRRQSTAFFRPWLDQPSAEIDSQRKSLSPSPSNLPPAQPYHANMVRSHPPRQRSPKEQQHRDRNTLASLRYRRSKQAQEAALERQYTQYRSQHELILEQQMRLSLYYVRYLQQVAATAAPLTTEQQQQQWRQQMAQAQTPVLASFRR
ncbi:protein Mabiki [Scaptodrosophila lebanonensis]|uniref:Protein Mabiki n=1 Tax=Drosophila lebanonensis TaxID=7225 RepID=A0A6J2TMB1_DROLE|nr:protein Mabiki [Scaptodrosophila lebanonensis]